MPGVYTILGNKSSAASAVLGWRDWGSIMFFEPTTRTPRKDTETAISLGCETISIYLTEGEDHCQQVVEIIAHEIRLGRSAVSNHAPLVPKGDTTLWLVIGSSNLDDTNESGASYQRIFANENSSKPGEDLERAISLGATNITLEVKQWERAKDPLMSSTR